MLSGIDRINESLAKQLDGCEAGSDDEIISSEELEESEAAWQDYLTGRDSGETLSKVRWELLGHE